MPQADAAVAVARRALLGPLALAVLAPSLAVGQPPGGSARIVVLGLSSPADQVRAFEAGLRALGYADGTTITLDHRSAEGRAAALPALAREAVALRPRVIVAMGAAAAIAAQRATKDLPIVAVTGDITAAGLVTNLGRPEGNVTGLSFFAADLMLKRFELLMELAPQLRRLAVIVESPPHPTLAKGLAGLRARAATRGVEVLETHVARAEEVKRVLVRSRKPGVEGVLLSQSVIFDGHAAEIGRMAAEHRLIAMLPWKEYALAGGLVAYAPDILALWHRAATYVDRILRGARPADLPVEQPTKFELVVNLKTARAVGLVVPPAFLLRADLVLE